MTSRKGSCTDEAAATFRPNFAVIFMIDLSVAKFKRKLRDPKVLVE